MALKRNAKEDDLLVKDIMNALVSSQLVEKQYAESLLMRLHREGESG